MAVRRFGLPTLCFWLAVIPLLASEGRVPIATTPTVITSPGHYVLTRNLGPNPGAGSVIEIEAPHVDLDLNGFQIDNGASGSPTVLVRDGFADVRIHNGTITGGTDSIKAWIGRRLVIEDLNMHFSGGYALSVVDVDEVVIRNNRISDTALEGIYLFSGNPKTGIIEGNQLRRTGSAIRVTDVAGMTIRLNQLEEIFGYGILSQHAGGLLIERNTVESAEEFGIYLEDTRGSKILDNVLHGNTQSGIVLLDDCDDNFILDNVVTGSANNHGIFIHGNRNHIEGNLSNSNGWCGFQFSSLSSGNVYRRNFARGNNGPNCTLACTTPVVSTTDLCDEGSSNTSALDNFLPNPGM